MKIVIGASGLNSKYDPIFSITANFAPDATYEASVPIYFWYMNGAIANNVPLVTLN